MAKRKENPNLTEGGEEEGQPCTQKARTGLDNHASGLVVSEIKHTVLDCFSENLRELIVQSLASKISENNYINDPSSADYGNDTMNTNATSAGHLIDTLEQKMD